MATATHSSREHGNAYNLFILVLTVVSLVVMVLLWMPFSAQTLILLRTYDNVICVIFLFDFGLSLFRAPSKRAYFIGQRGWLDLLGSLPSIGGADAIGILRLARLSRLARITRLLRGQNKQEIVNDVLGNRAQYAVMITILAAFLVMGTASIIVLQAESGSPTANITTGGDALWWAMVTITTVGYGDFYPTTPTGRIAAVFVMIMGIGIIGSLASILASFLVSPANSPSDNTPVASSDLEQTLDRLRVELEVTRAELATMRGLMNRSAAHSPADGHSTLP